MYNNFNANPKLLKTSGQKIVILNPKQLFLLILPQISYFYRKIYDPHNP